jgi:ABC-type iron transport system FetAB ATPase subunit
MLLGPSGSGKSTLLRCLNRLAEPEAGTVWLEGRDIREEEPSRLRRRVALVAQAPVMLPGTVADNLAYGLRDPQRAKLGECLAAAGLDASFLERSAAALSGGERARVAFARALTREPDAMLLDEPTAALDELAVDVVCATIRTLARRGLALVVATHDLGVAGRVGDRALRLAGGRAEPLDRVPAAP